MLRTAFVTLSLAAGAFGQTAPAFEVASVKNQPWIKNEYSGFACRGTDGVHGMPFGNRGFANISIPQGRCRGEFAPLSQVIGFAYDVLARLAV